MRTSSELEPEGIPVKVYAHTTDNNVKAALQLSLHLPRSKRSHAHRRSH